MNWKLKYTSQAFKFLEKTALESIDPIIRKAIEKVISLENTNINIRKMKGEWKAFYRIRQGNLRIIIKFEPEDLSVLIYRIGWRGNVYK